MRVLDGVDADGDARGAARRAPRDRGPRRGRGALDRRRRRRAVPRRARRRAAGRPAGGVPGGRARRAGAAGQALRGHPRSVHARRAAGPLRRRPLGRAAASSSATARSCEASCAPAAPSASGAIPRCCAGCAAPRWRCCARRSSRSTSARWPGSSPPGRTSTATRPRAPGSIGCARRWSRCRGWRCPPTPGSATCSPRRVGAYSPAWMDQLCASGEVVWIGAGALGRNSGRVALYFREDLADAGAAAASRRQRRQDRSRRSTTRSARGWPRARASSPICWPTSTLAPEELQEALWDLAWAGEATNDAFAPLRAPRLTLARAQRDACARPRARAGRFGSRRRGGAAAQVQGRWSLTEPLFRERGRSRPPAGGRWPSCCSSATGC